MELKVASVAPLRGMFSWTLAANRNSSCGTTATMCRSTRGPLRQDVLNRIGDIKVLGSCVLVSRRFHVLVLLVNSVFVRVDCIIPTTHPPPPPPPYRILSPAAAAISWCSEPLPASLSAPAANVSHQSTTRAPRCSAQLWCLHIELPTGELGTDDGVLLKWKADFGSTLGSCVILGASSYLSSNSVTDYENR
ncbi:F-box protein At1g30200-like [Miscanthus floridulus]|uniref:F-box protein At1g30200-like n=1 Tax=Miscanthus floridulus TaxID=154761 RepID=UPI003457FE3E